MYVLIDGLLISAKSRFAFTNLVIGSTGIDEDDMPAEDAAADEEMPPLEEDDDSAKMEEVD